MSPYEIVRYLQGRGYALRYAKGMVHVSPKPSDEDAELIKANKIGIVSVLTNCCYTCNQPLRTIADNDRYLRLECPIDATHFSLLLNKRPGEQMGFFLDYAQGKCSGCGTEGELFAGRCQGCVKTAVEQGQSEAVIA